MEKNPPDRTDSQIGSVGRAGNTGKYIKYAFGEIVLVMIGILLALQVNNWNIERTDKIREVKYLKNIELDLQKDLKSLTYLIDFRKTKYRLIIPEAHQSLEYKPIDQSIAGVHPHQINNRFLHHPALHSMT